MSVNVNDDEFPNQLSSVEHRHRNNLWRSNYHEAAIYIEEGLNNDKFENHPRRRASLATNVGFDSQEHHGQNQTSPFVSCVPQKHHKNNYLLGGQYTTIETYILVHNRYFYQLDLAASIVLLLLALFEPPAINGYELNPIVHAGTELFALCIIATELLLKFRWMGPRRFFHHGRTVTKLVVLLTMNIEAIVILLRHSTHVRYTRALRPIFLIDNHYCHGIRRAVRQIFQSLPPILDMFTLALFFLFIFSIFGFYLFAVDNEYFSDMPATVGNLLIFATTANMPDIMLLSYAKSRWSAIYYVLFVIIHLFLLTNITMAAVYESFTRREKEKFHKLLLHRRKACQEAFKLLVSRRHPNRLQYRQFMGLMRYLNRKCSMFDSYLIFKALDSDKSGSISLEEFYQIYDYINLEWKLIYPETGWYDDCCGWTPGFIRKASKFLARIVKDKMFEHMVEVQILLTALLQFFEATQRDIVFNTTTDIIKPDSISTSIFIALFSIETLMRLLAFGITSYWSQRWNRFDLLVLSLSFGGLVSGYLGGAPFGWVIVLRILRLIRLLELKRRYRDIWQTLTYILAKRFVSMTCLVLILYYFFAIVGMELLGKYDLRNCCKNTTLESHFKFNSTVSSEGTLYYLNDFGDLVASYVTLFSMTSSTYWLTEMSAYAIVTGSNAIRIYFALYYITSIIVINIVIAFILESFLFRIHYRSTMGDSCDDASLFTVRVTLSSSETDFLEKNSCRCGTIDQNGKSLPFDSNFEQMLRVAREQRKLFQTQRDSAERTFNKVDSHLGERSSLLGSPRRSPELQEDGSGGDWYLIYQADQIRNKFSFTMKMYAEEVEGWLAEAEGAENRDDMGVLISQNQIRAEHVAMARLARRSLAARNKTLIEASNVRNRSYSSGASGLARPGTSCRGKLEPRSP